MFVCAVVKLNKDLTTTFVDVFPSFRLAKRFLMDENGPEYYSTYLKDDRNVYEMYFFDTASRFFVICRDYYENNSREKPAIY